MQDKPTELEKLKKQLEEEQKKRGKKAAGSAMKTATRTRGRKTVGQDLGISKEPAHKRARTASAVIKASSVLGEEEEEEEEVEVIGKVPSVDWKKSPELTDELLTLIEDNDARRIALGFKKSGNLKGSGQTSHTIKDHCMKIANVLLIKHPSGRWACYSEEDLFNIIRQRVNYLKKRFSDIRDKMEATGHGFVMAEEDEDLGSGDKTPWGKVRKDFPWYDRMMGLMQDSPVFDTKACSNSTTSLDEGLQELLPQRNDRFPLRLKLPIVTTTLPAGLEKNEDVDTEPEVFLDGWERTPSPESASPVDKSTVSLVTPSAVSFASQVSSSPSPASSFGSYGTTMLAPGSVTKGQKRGRMNQQEQLDFVLSSNRAARENMLRMKLESRQFEQKQAALEADKARAHELKVLEMKIQLARAQGNYNNGYVSGNIHVSSPLSVPDNSSLDHFSQLSFPSPSSIPPAITYDSFPTDTQFPSHSSTSSSK